MSTITAAAKLPAAVAPTTARPAAQPAPAPAPPADQFSFEGVELNAAVPSKADIAKMGYAKFDGWVQDHAKGGFMSEMAEDEVASGYADIKTESNKAAASASLKPAEADALFGTADKIANWQSQRLETIYTYEGGGTMYHHAMSRDYASLTDSVGEAINQWNVTPSITPGQLEPAKLAFQSSAPDPTGGYVDLNTLHQNEAQEVVLLSDSVASTQKLAPGAQVVFNGYIQNEAKGWSAGNIGG